MIENILKEYGLDEPDFEIKKFGSGLINHTWVVAGDGEKYILQKVNHQVFKTPEDIASNIQLIDDYLKKNHPEYLFIAQCKTKNGENIVHVARDGYYRAFPFVGNSHSIDVVETPEQAYEAAKQFGRFTRLLSGINIDELKITLPSFHDLSLRYCQYRQALENGNPARIKQANVFIEKLNRYSYIVDEFEALKKNPDFKLRVTHHDTKISNVLFDDEDKGICVIDLDTVMPGYFISDVGDMMRTYLSPVSEEEKDYDKIVIRDDFYRAIARGYKEEMCDELTETENKYFFYSGTFMVYMQALRFITDHLNNDVYYGARYEGHNFVRGGNQIALLEKLIAKKDILSAL